MHLGKSGRDNSEILKELVEALVSRDDAQNELWWRFVDENGTKWSDERQKEHYELVLKVNDCSRRILRLVEEAKTNNGWKGEGKRNDDIRGIEEHALDTTAVRGGA